MRKLKFKSLTMRIWTTFTIIILIIICSISFLYLFAYKRINENNKMADLKVLHDILLHSDEGNNPSAQINQLKNLKGSEHFIVVINNDGRIGIREINRLGVRKEVDGENGIMPQPLKDMKTKQWMAGFINGNMEGAQFKESFNGIRYVFVITEITNNEFGRHYLLSYIPTNIDNTIIYTVLIIGLGFIFIGFVTAKVVANNIAKPLKELENHTNRIAKKNWTNPIEVKSQDEIGRLAESMNRMQVELKRIDQEEKTFLQSISHDLKTPVMVIMSHAEAIIDGIYIDSVEKTAEIIKEESISLEKKIKQLLYLNTLDYVLDNNEENSIVDLRKLLLHIVSRFEVVNSSIEWNLDIAKGYINGNEEKIKVALENILENALRYAETLIEVNLKSEDKFGIIEIYNDGANISEKNINNIFETLYKDKTGNFGLGLAISKKIVEFYKGEINAINREKGVSFVIKYPL